MPSELDRRFDAELARVTGPGGRLVIGRDALGRAIVDNFPATLPDFFRAFCALNADNEALVAGDERLSFAELDRISECAAHGLAARGIGKGDRVGLAMRNWLSLVAMIVLPLVSYAYRIAVEERALARELGTPYEDYMRRTNRLVPWTL